VAQEWSEVHAHLPDLPLHLPMDLQDWYSEQPGGPPVTAYTRLQYFNMPCGTPTQLYQCLGCVSIRSVGGQSEPRGRSPVYPSTPLLPPPLHDTPPSTNKTSNYTVINQTTTLLICVFFAARIRCTVRAMCQGSLECDTNTRIANSLFGFC